MKTQRRTLTGLAALGALLAIAGMPGCADESTDATESTASPLLGGTPTNARPEVVLWNLPSGYCSATMISSTTFLSAGHCINHAWEVTGSPAGTLTNTALSQGPIAVERVFSQGLADAAGGSTNPDDFAFGRLVSPMSGITPDTISSVEPGAGTLTVMGYGCTTARGSGCSPTGRTFITYHYDGSTPSNFSAPGDSGGPTFLFGLTDGGPIIRTASGYFCDIFGSCHDVGSDAVAYRNQILGMSTAMQTTGISYRSQVQGQGWQGGVSNGALTGTTGQSLRLEAIQVWSETPGVVPAYRAYVEGSGWQTEVFNGAMAGTVGQSLRMEAIQVRLRSPGPFSHVQYRAYIQNTGWQPWVTDGTVCSTNSNCATGLCASGTCAAGTTGQSRRIEALEMSVF